MDDQAARPALKTIIDVIIPMIQQMIAEGEPLFSVGWFLCTIKQTIRNHLDKLAGP